MNETRRALLDELAGGPVSGPTLAATLDVSRAAVWKQVEALRTEGFGIESTDDGYVVTSVPEFGASAVAYGLDADWAIEYHDSIGSTNDRGRELATAGETDVVVLADEQTGSRGRLRREWTAPSGGVWMSLVFAPDRPPAHAPIYTLAAAVATTRAAREAGVDASIKWPNDILVNTVSEGTSDESDGVIVVDEDAPRGGRKLAGVLTEMEGEADRISWMLVGIGVNANIDRDDLPAGATSIRAEAGDVERRLFVQRLIEEFDDLSGDPEGVLDAWRASADTLGRRVRVETATETIEGEAVDVEFPGALVVRTAEGERTVHAGDCEHLRPV
ncbi:biotin--[acetyl-CoA-carboxylase] ligase [Salinigranum sp. GCM10025319]|uniref:biotin--[acetyl-CoA-carboxylase] ligase n=1 Tax=Salinigranum sp. GCM10025319 TaxID=3252687 RepID=UPI00361B6965